jgi:hypothetical protein
MSLKKYSDFEDPNEKSKIVEKFEEPEISEPKQEPIKEEVLLTPKVNSNNLEIEILEDKIIKFNTGNIKDIMETLKSKYSDTDYFFRKKDGQIHVVKYNENLKLNINEFVNTLFKFYSTKMELRKIVEGIKIKGNNNFCIIENMKSQYNQKFVDDLTGLLSKKKQ